MVFFTALFCIIEKDSLKPGLAALALTYALNITGSMVWMVRMACDLENSCVALERILEYTKLTPEAPWETEKGKSAHILAPWQPEVECSPLC